MVFQIAAFIILAVFYGCYFLKMFRQHQRGIQTDQIGRDKTGFVKGVERTMKAASFLVPIAEVVSILLNTAPLPLWARILGAGLGTLGAAVFISAVLTMGDSWRAGVSKRDKTALVTGGIFRWSRNPAFLGFDLVYLGMVLMFFNLPLFWLSLFAALVFHLQIVNVEEPFLQETFGETYLTYQKQVCRYLGRRR